MNMHFYIYIRFFFSNEDVLNILLVSFKKEVRSMLVGSVDIEYNE